MNRNAWMILFALTFVTASVNQAEAQFGNLFRRGPSVEVISTSELASKLGSQIKEVREDKETNADPGQTEFVLVDVRSQSEINVSMIPGAITKQQYEQNADKYRGKTVIPYCTVGGRSGAYAKQLASNGVKVQNYKGSILDWVKNGLPVVTPEGKATNRVHTYSDRYRIPAQYQQVTD